MEIFENLKNEFQRIEYETYYQGHYFRISNILQILVFGLLCGLREIDDIHEWAISRPTRDFLENYFGIPKVPCRAQFYNILRYVDASKFNESFVRWMNGILETKPEGKTISLDGKAICSTNKLADNKCGLSIISAIISEHNLVIGSMECGSKQSEVEAFRELVDLLDVSDAIIVADALHCKKKTAKAVISAGAD